MSVKIENIKEFRKVAAEYDVAMPVGRGRPPVRKLAQALADAGVTVEPTAYFDGVVRQIVAHVGPRGYVVSALVPQRDKQTGEVKTYSAKGKHATRAGEPIYGPKLSKVTISAEQIDEFTGKTQRGRKSQSDTLAAAAQLAGWGDAELLKNATVTRV